MTSRTAVFETQHEDMIHDAQMDYYGKRLATASSDKTIKIFQVEGDQQTLIAHLKGHDGPVWQVAWGHPRFGNILASCSYDGRVVVWKEMQGAQGAPPQWAKVYEDVSNPRTSVNSVAFAPHTFGLQLAAACSDGSICVYTHRDDQRWESVKIDNAHLGGCNAVSWGPDCAPGSMMADGQPPMQSFVSAGCDNKIKIWGLEMGQWTEQKNKFDAKYKEKAHDDWVRDVAWAPSLGLLSNTIASCSEDKTVAIWSEENGVWRKAKSIPFSHKVWRVSWSPMGNVLAVSQGDNKVSLWKETVDGEWKNLSAIQGNE